MAEIGMSVNVTMKGPLFSKGFALKEPLGRAALKIANVVEKAAQKDFLSKKKAEPKMPSMIFDSFKVEPGITTNNEARAIVFAGGPTAPWTIFVDQPRKGFKGYYFMYAGAQEGARQASEIVSKELKTI